MHEAVAYDAQSVHQTVYHFCKIQIELDATDKEVFGSQRDGGLLTGSKQYPIVWHEYCHYLQNIGTTIGIRIFFNLVALLGQFSVAVAQRDPLLVPMIKDPQNPFPHQINDLLAQMGRLMGFKVPLDMSPPATIPPFEPYLDAKDDSHAFLCVEANGQRVGVPLYGNVFVEGMAKGIQWLIETPGQWDGSLLVGRTIDGNGVYYDAIIRYFAHHAPKSNPCALATIISHAALQTTQPAKFFVAAHVQGMAKAAAVSSLSDFATAMRAHSEVKDGIATGLSDIARYEEDNAHNAGTPYYEMMLAAAQVMRDALTSYRDNPQSFGELVNPTMEGLKSLAATYYFPPLYTRDVDSLWSLHLSARLNELFWLVAAMFTLALDVNNTNMIDVECSLLRKRYCTFPKSKKTYCQSERLNHVESEGRLCVMGQAANMLGLWRKKLSRLA